MTIPGVNTGDVLAGKYRVERILGAGGMGVVVAARHLQLGQNVALKFLRAEACAVPGAVERFLREARAAVQIRSEHVSRVSDVGTLEDGAPYMVMEYLEGRDLATLLRSRGHLPIEEAIDCVLQACEAIAEAHAIGIVHRDIKPANLFVTTRADGSRLVKVLDFGISKAAPLDGESGGSITATATVMGSPLYMSPEQIRSAKHVDARTDVWALGIVLHELLTGRSAFCGETVAGVLAAVVADVPPPLRSQCPDAPAGLEAVLQHCLEKDVSRRCQSVAVLAKALLPFAAASSRVSVERILRLAGSTSGSTQYATEDAPVATIAAPATRSGSVAPWGTTGLQGGSRRIDRRRSVWIPVASLVVVGASAVTWFVARRDTNVVATAPHASRESATASPPAGQTPPATLPSPPSTPVAPTPVAPTPEPAESPSPPSSPAPRTAAPTPRPEPVFKAVALVRATADAGAPVRHAPATIPRAPGAPPTPATPGTTDYDHF
jgi:serine/threonine protein kinase